MIREIVGVFEVHRDSRQAGDARHTSADTSAARTALGFAPQVSLKAGLEAEARWIEQNLSLLGA